ncbi:hypothetical protein DUNSADRAFT_8856 [Dunaliella salina]|uniref:Encoded protein n=1 Tax=Dunaliella salina TaxID=3046 RepID=A0ABQ7H5N4_DUNSA|nr:hypothetical protein DUNSADRAFT_8856 [Dunaliella salina]|eukprot:KAF5842169.1 hypothetical protein DUNSADRAFT_8856 [Dunaliella salina]
MHIVHQEDFEVYCDEPSPPAAPSSTAAPPPADAGASVLDAQAAGQAAAPLERGVHEGVQVHHQRQPLGDRTAEYWGGYYRPLIEADEAAALQSPMKAPSPSLRPGFRQQSCGSPTKHTPSKPNPALHHPLQGSSHPAAGAPMGLPPRSPLPPRHPPAQQQLFPTAGLSRTSSLPPAAAGAPSPFPAGLQVQTRLEGVAKRGMLSGSAGPSHTPLNPALHESPHPGVQQAQVQPAMGLAALLQQQKQQEQQQQQLGSGLKRGHSPGPESASKVKRGLMFPP